MARQVLNNNESAFIFRTKLNDNFTELYGSRAPINHASGSTTYGVASTTQYGHIRVTNGNGLTVNNGILSMGVASTSVNGAVRLVNNATTNDSTKAATAAALKTVADSAVKTYSGTGNPANSQGKNGDIYAKIT